MATLARAATIAEDFSVCLDEDEWTLAQQLIELLEERGGGSVLRGWRSELDLEGALRVSFSEMCKAIHKLGLEGDVSSLFPHGSNTLKVSDLLPKQGALILRFQEWVKETFGGPKDMFKSFDAAHRGSIDMPEFVEACRSHGLSMKESDLIEIFACCDCFDAGAITIEEVFFLESDSAVREFDLFKSKTRGKNQRQRLLADFYKEEQKRALPQMHRLAMRPWHAERFETLPRVMSERRRARQNELSLNAMKARTVFLAHLQKCYGSVIRAWRRELDPSSTFCMSLPTLRQFCVRTSLNVDTTALWRSLDKDEGGSCAFEELSPEHAEVIASFQSWANAACGSCRGIWDSSQARMAREIGALNAAVRRQSQEEDVSEWSPPDTKMRFRAFTELLRQLGWSGVDVPRMRSILYTSLDLFGCGFVSRDDLAWVDKWHPPSWILAVPDEGAWHQLREKLGEGGKRMLSAWRLHFDVDGNNMVTWIEFSNACNRIEFRGNVAGAWRHLDKAMDGYITIRDFDAASAELLLSFKNWADSNFGSMMNTYKSLDSDGDGTISFGELKRACNKFKWQGDCHLLFNCLDIDRKRDAFGSRSIAFIEIAFLDTWEPSAKELLRSPQDDVAFSVEAGPRTPKTPKTPGSMGSARQKGTRLSTSMPLLPALTEESTSPKNRVGEACGCPQVSQTGESFFTVDEASSPASRASPSSMRKPISKQKENKCRLQVSISGEQGEWGGGASQMPRLQGGVPYWASITHGAALEKWQHQEPRKVWRSPIRLHPLCAPGSASSATLDRALQAPP